MAEKSPDSERETRVPLDWYQRVDRLEVWKRRLLIGATLAATAWLGAGLFGKDRGRFRYAPAPVAAVHATWEDNCQACHVPFTPVNSNSWLSGWFDRSHVGAVQCKSCHAGGIHHAKQLDDGENCASCHHEHQGRAAQLVRVADKDCTSCHDDLKAHLRPQTETDFKVVSRFDAEHHPEFRLLREDHPQPVDPRHLKFSHAVHMTPGMNCDFTLADIDPMDRKRYAAGEAATAAVRLECASCHRLDARDPSSPRAAANAPRTSGVALDRSAGAYMVPITYENECRACHPLTFDRRSADDPKAGLLAVPHGLQPDAVRDFVWGAYANEYVSRQAPSTNSTRPLPGRAPADEAKARAAINQELAGLEKFLYRERLSQAQKILFRGRQTCGECHSFETANADTVPKRVVPTSIPDVWFKHARFDHSAHRAVACRDCHAQAYAEKDLPSDKQTVMLPGRDVCLACHAPASSSGTVHGGARFDCVECHRFHNGDEPLQGMGAAARGVPDAERRSIRDFLTAPRRRSAGTASAADSGAASRRGSD